MIFENKFFEIDVIVFDTDELLKALRQGFRNIGLCDNVFHIPNEFGGVYYTGIGDAAAVLYVKDYIDIQNTDKHFSAIRVERVITGSAFSVLPINAYAALSSFSSSFSSSFFAAPTSFGSYRTSYLTSYRSNNNNNNNNNNGGRGSYLTSYRSSYSSSYRLSSYSSSYPTSLGYRTITRRPHTGAWGALLDELFGLEIIPGGYGLELI